MSKPPARFRPPTYAERLRDELNRLEVSMVSVVESSTIVNTDPNRGLAGSGIVAIGYPRWGWGPSDGALDATRMQTLDELRGLEPRLRLLFPHPVARVAKTLDGFFSLFEKWLRRGRSGHSVPASLGEAVARVRAEVSEVADLLDHLPADPEPIRVVVDTNALIDCPDLAAYTGDLGRKYTAHLMPVVLGELDDLRRSGRTPELREAAAKAVRRLKGLRTNGDPRVGVRVAGEVVAVFEHVEPHGGDLPGWLDLAVPDDRFVASALLLQSKHPGSAVYAATGDLNLQNKLAAVGIPFVERPGS